MKRVSILVFVLFTCLVKGQDFEIKQITSGDFDATNPVVGKNYFWESNGIFFELHDGNSINIYYSNYNPEDDSFSDTNAVTNGVYQNINPVADYNGGIAFQTNQNGNWDIAYKKYENGGWGETEFLTNTPEDEINLKEVFTDPYFFGSKIHLIFERDGSVIYLYVDSSRVYEETVFQKTNEINYDQSAGVFLVQGFPEQDGIHIAVVETDHNDIKRIISRHRNDNGTWDPINIVKDTCSCSNLIFQPVDFYPGLIFEDETGPDKKLMTILDWQNSKESFPLFSSQGVSYSGYQSAVSYLVTKPTVGRTDFLLYHPHSYQMIDTISTKIRLNMYDFVDQTIDSFYTVKVNNEDLEIGSLGFNLNYEIFYTIFEDSADGNVHLFGRKFLYPVGGIGDENHLNDFSLCQNYPNPFNPKTKINWQSTAGSWQTLKVYDVLGNEIAALVNEYRPAGSYSAEFDASKLSSGIYFYRLKAGDFSETKKMILLK